MSQIIDTKDKCEGEERERNQWKGCREIKELKGNRSVNMRRRKIEEKVMCRGGGEARGGRFVRTASPCRPRIHEYSCTQRRQQILITPY